MHISMKFSDLDQINDQDFTSLCLALEKIAFSPDELFAQLAGLLLQTVCVAELDRRVDGIGPQVHQLGIDMTADPESIRWIAKLTERMRNHLLQAAKPASAEMFNVITQSFSTELQRVSAGQTADISELERLFNL